MVARQGSTAQPQTVASGLERNSASSELRMCALMRAVGGAAAGWQAQQAGCGPLPEVGGCLGGSCWIPRGLLGWQLLHNGTQWLASTSPPHCNATDCRPGLTSWLPARPPTHPAACRVIGARDVLAIGDCSLMEGDRLPATAQAS